jgi:hypothetical protein
VGATVSKNGCVPFRSVLKFICIIYLKVAANSRQWLCKFIKSEGNPERRDLLFSYRQYMIALMDISMDHVIPGALGTMGSATHDLTPDSSPPEDAGAEERAVPGVADGLLAAGGRRRRAGGAPDADW